jgi:hypothetical protein
MTTETWRNIMRYVPVYVAAGGVCVASLGLWVFTDASNSAAPRKLQPEVVPPAAPLVEALAKQERMERQLNATNFNLGQRLRLIEDQLNTQRSSQPTNTNGTPPSPVEPQPPSENDFAQWMEDSLASSARDQGVTDAVNAEAVATLAQVPEVQMAELECSSRFCRAMLVGEEGNEPPVKKLFKLPPFATSGFSMPDKDGKVALYFTRPGEELDSLRSEAFSEAAPGL